MGLHRVTCDLPSAFLRWSVRCTEGSNPAEGFFSSLAPVKYELMQRARPSRFAIAALLCFGSLCSGQVPVKSGVTFARDVWPILQTRCVTCHQPGAIGPMAFTSYAEARPWARAIREAVVSRSMPPWHAAPGNI